MRMPIADEVKALAKPFLDLDSFGRAVGEVGGSRSAIPGSCARCFRYYDPGTLDSREQLTARFSVPDANLTVRPEVLEHDIAERQDLAGIADRILDHVASARHAGHRAFPTQALSKTKPPSERTPVAASHSSDHAPPARSSRSIRVAQILCVAGR